MRIILGVTLAGLAVSCVGTEDDIGSADSALTYEQIVEAETATGAGVVLSDASASGGAYLRNTTLYTTANASFTLTGTVQDAVITARKSGSCTPLLTVRMDGIDVAQVTVSAASWTDYPVSIAAGPGGHTLGLYYRSGVNGCAIDVDAASLTIYEPPPPPPTTTTLVEAELASGPGTVVIDPIASNGQYRQFTQSSVTATMPFSIPDPLVSASVRVRGGSCGPLVHIKIDGQVVLMRTVYEPYWVDVPISTGLAAGNHTLEIYSRWATAACPLNVDVMTLQSAPPPPPPVTTIYQAEAAVGGGVIESDATANGGQLRLFTAGRSAASMIVTTTGTFLNGTVRVRGSSLCPPYGSVSIDGTVVWSGYVSGNAWTDVPIGAASFAPGDHTLTFTSRSASPSCPLRFDSSTWVTSAP